MSDIVIKNLSVSFDGVDVLKSFSHTFKENTLTCIMGSSGCGKTTLFNAMLGFVPVQEGSVEGMPDKVSCVFQENRLCEDFSALSNVMIAAKKGFTKYDGKSLLLSLGIDKVNDAVSTFSGGMKRRVALARALAADSRLIMLDEGFKGLDDDARIKAIEVLKKHSFGKTVISITHTSDEPRLMDAEVLTMSKIST